jgi:hypothetical protein
MSEQADVVASATSFLTRRVTIHLLKQNVDLHLLQE